MKKTLYIITLTLAFLVNSFQSFSQGNTCQQATPFCTAIGTPFVYPNVANGSVAQSGPNYGCLLSQPDPSWFYVKTSAAGVMTFSLSQTVNSDGTGGGIDVDFICWGPFSSPSNCNNLTSVMIEDCSFSPASTETMTINSPAAGAYYIVLITNYSGVTAPPGTPGYIAITQTGGPGTDCSIVCPPSTFTLVATNYNTSANIPNNSTVNCTDPFLIEPPTISPFTNPYSDILTPCIKTSFSPFTSNLNTNGSLSAYEAGTLAWAPYCPSSCGSTIGGSIATPGNDYFTGVSPFFSQR